MKNRKFKFAFVAAVLGCALSGASAMPASASARHVADVHPLGTPQWGEIANQNSNLCLEDHGYATGNGARVDQWACDGGSNQEWEFVSVGSIYYHIINRYTGLCLEVHGASTAESAVVDQWTCGSGANGIWYQAGASTDGNFSFGNEQTSYWLEVALSSTTNGATVDVYPANYTNTQYWNTASYQP